MKTGQPEYQIPSPVTVSRDVKNVFISIRKCIAKMLQVRSYHNCLRRLNNSLIRQQDYDGALNFATDAWTSPNNKAYIVVTVHFEKDGVLISMLLDLVEVACSHSGINLAAAFVKILDDFGIAHKVSSYINNRGI